MLLGIEHLYKLLPCLSEAGGHLCDGDCSQQDQTVTISVHASRCKSSEHNSLVLLTYLQFSPQYHHSEIEVYVCVYVYMCVYCI